jgi:hypothetical protein
LNIPSRVNTEDVSLACTAERYFRVDRAQEHLHYLTDIANDALFVLDTLPHTPDDETAFQSPASELPISPTYAGGLPKIENTRLLKR